MQDTKYRLYLVRCKAGALAGAVWRGTHLRGARHGQRLQPPRRMGERLPAASSSRHSRPRPAAPSRTRRCRTPQMAARSAAGTCSPGTRVRCRTVRRFRASGMGLGRARAWARRPRVRVPGPPSRRPCGLVRFSSRVVLYLFVLVLASRCFSFAFVCCRCNMFRMSHEKSANGSQKLLELPEEDLRALILSH